MLIEIILFLLIGIILGVIAGLLPGIHINLVGIILISLSVTLLSSINPVYLIVLITAMAISQTFLDFIPSILLGCPDTETQLSVLPGHELLKQGKGYEAILLTAYGSLAAIFILIIISWPSIILVSKTYDLIKSSIPYILIIVSLLVIFLEKSKKNSAIVFSLTGILGLIVLKLEVNQSLLPLLTGLFGISALSLSIKNKTIIPPQKIQKPKAKFMAPLTGSLIASFICGFLPGLGGGQAAVIANTISKTNKKGFLVLLGATNTLVMGFSFISLYVISKTRTGAAVAISEIIGQLNTSLLILILTVILISGILSFFITIYLAKFFSQRITKVKYSLLSILIIIFVTIIVIIVSGFMGLIILIISTLTGIYCISLGTRRTDMMGCLLLPTIMLYLV